MVTHHTASLISANPCGRCHPLARSSRSVVSRIAVIDQSSVPASAGRSLAFWRFPQAMGLMRRLFLRQLRSAVPDPVLRARLTPDHEIGCKRITVSSDWYPALQRPHAEVVGGAVEGLTADGLVVGGVVHPCDVVVLATGFATTEFLTGVSVTGRDGSTLADAWRDGASAHLGLSVPGFPNMFLVYGPNTNSSGGSIVFYLEAQARYIRQAIAVLARLPEGGLEIRRSVYEASDRALQQRFTGTAWTRCDSWYRTESGRIVTNWPGYMRQYEQATERVDPSEYVFHPCPGPTCPQASSTVWSE